LAIARRPAEALPPDQENPVLERDDRDVRRQLLVRQLFVRSLEPDPRAPRSRSPVDLAVDADRDARAGSRLCEVREERPLDLVMGSVIVEAPEPATEHVEIVAERHELRQRDLRERK